MMTWISRTILLVSFMNVLSACSFGPARDAADLAVPEAPKYGPMKPNPFGANIALSQTITGRFGEKERSLRFEVEFKTNHLVMVALTHLGVPVFSIEYDGEVAQIERFVSAADQIDPFWILNDFLLVYWPEEELSPALKTAGYQLRPKPQGRDMINGQNDVAVSVTYLDAPALGVDVDLENHQFDYMLKVRTHKIIWGPEK